MIIKPALPGRYRVYMAGPDVFRPDYPGFVEHARRIGSDHGLELIFPIEPNDELTLAQQAQYLFHGNVARILSCSAVCANLSPFRGPSVDAGTAVEIGIAIGRNLAISGYSFDAHPYASRVDTKSVGGVLTDHNGYLVESFGLSDNLMVVCGLLSCRPFVSMEAALRSIAVQLDTTSVD